jgi:hypothetical protein
VSEELIDKARRLLRPVDPHAPEPTLAEMLRQRDSEASRDLSLQELCEFHARRTGQRILRVERDS